MSRACTCHTLLLQRSTHSSSLAMLRQDHQWLHGLQLVSLNGERGEGGKGRGGGGKGRGGGGKGRRREGEENGREREGEVR